MTDERAILAHLRHAIDRVDDGLLLLLAARLHGEPLPLDARLAQALGTQRLWSRCLQQPR